MLDERSLIVGAGPIGLACAISAKRRGIDPLVIDSGMVCDSIFRYPVGMTFFTTPERLEIGGHPLVCSGQKPTREEALKYYRGVVRAEGIRVRPYTKLVHANRNDAGIVCRLETPRGPEECVAERLVLATGYFDHPKRLDVPGEDLPHFSPVSSRDAVSRDVARRVNELTGGVFLTRRGSTSEAQRSPRRDLRCRSRNR